MHEQNNKEGQSSVGMSLGTSVFLLHASTISMSGLFCLSCFNGGQVLTKRNKQHKFQCDQRIKHKFCRKRNCRERNKSTGERIICFNFHPPKVFVSLCLSFVASDPG